MGDDSKPGWFFSPPVGPSIGDATLDDVLGHLARDDDHWSVEAPATAENYCRENWAPLIYSDGEPYGLRVRADVYYIDRGLFTVGVSGTRITDPAFAVDPATGERLDVPGHWLDVYPVLGGGWDELLLDVSRQGHRYRYPRAVAATRDQIAAVVRCLFETKSLYGGCGWIAEMEYARRFRWWFYAGDD